MHEILVLPGGTRLFIGHDYDAEGRDESGWETTVDRHRAENIHVGGDIGKAEYIALR